MPFVNTYNAIKKKRLTVDDVQKIINRDKDIVLVDNELARKEKLSKELDEQINENNATLSNLKMDISVLSMVNMVLTQIVKILTREKERLGLFLPSYATRYNYGPNNNLIHVSYRSIWY